MASGSHSPTEAGNFHFVSIGAPDDVKDPVTRRRARSHAVKHALEHKRKLEQESRENFRVMTMKNKPGGVSRRQISTRSLAGSPASLSSNVLDPFQALAVNCKRLQELFQNHKAQVALEPIFTMGEGFAFQSFQAVFRVGFVDPALLNAVMFAFVFSVTGGNINREGLGYQAQAISHIRAKMSVRDEATSESTIGAILLLAGVEARLGMTGRVQLHLGAVKQLVEMRQVDGLSLTGGIKRAIFWQDLNSSIIAGSDRIVDHTTFTELQWRRDVFPADFFRLPPGFQRQSHLHCKEFIEILMDIQALQCTRERQFFRADDSKMMMYINNHIASIHSRLANLPKVSPAIECCRLSAYLCSLMLCCTIWCALLIRSHISSQLLFQLKQAGDDPLWDDHPDLLLWILGIGGAFALPGAIRSEYVSLLRKCSTTRFRGFYGSWPELLEVFKQYTWSDKAFLDHIKTLWEETSPELFQQSI